MTVQSFSPGLDGVIATASSVSYLDEENEQIVVRGYDLIELARRAGATRTQRYLAESGIVERLLASAAAPRETAAAGGD